MAGRQKRWERLREMDWEEIRTRLTQETQKRLDLAFYRLGFPAAPESLLQSPLRRPKFFFSALDLAGRVEMLREHLFGPP